MKLALVVTPASVAVTEGMQSTFMVALNRAPEADVTVAVTSSDRTIVTATPAALVFTRQNFATAQAVIVQGVQDADLNNDSITVALTANGLDTVNVRVDVTDDDQLTIVMTPPALTILEGMTGSIDIKLGARPSGSVTVTVASANAAKLTVAPATLTFDAGNFDSTQRVTVTTLQDPDAAADMVAVTATAPGSQNMPSTVVTINDDDALNLGVTPASLTLTEGNPTAGTFTVRLTQQPTANVMVNLSSMNTQVATVSPATMTFTPANYNTPQTASVLPVQDDNTTMETTTITVAAAGLTSVSVAITVMDDDVQRITINPAAGVAVNEGGTTTFSVRMAFNPSATVSVSIATSNMAKATTNPTSLTFNAANFATPQTVTVTGVQDTDLANESVTLTLQSVGAQIETLPVAVSDDDSQTLTVTPTTMNLREGTTGTFTVRLGFQPAADTTVTLTTSAAAVATAAPASLTFTQANFATPQTVTVTGVQDPDLAPNTARITVAIPGATPAVTPVDVTVNVQDDDEQNISALPGNLALTEGMAPGTVQVTLGFPPAADTVVNIVSDNPGKVMVSPATMTFTPTNFSVPQPLTVSVVNDDDAIDETATVTLTSATITMPTNVAVTVDDDEVQLHVLTPTSLMMVEGDPTGATFTVQLSARPLAAVTVNVVSSNSNKATAVAVVGSLPLTFTPANYDQPQTIRVTGVQDPDLVDEAVTITVSSTIAPNATVTVGVQEDDFQDLVVTPLVNVQPATANMDILEDGPPGAINVSLKFQPATSVSVRVQSTNPSTISVNTLGFVDLLFTTTNYATPQVISVRTPTDNNLDDPAPTTVVVGLCGAACGPAPPNGNPFLANRTVNVDPREDDRQAIVSSVTGSLGVLETATETVQVHLAFEPLGSGMETVTATSGDTAVATVSPGTLAAFNQGNYTVDQAVMVTGVDDADVLTEPTTLTLHSTSFGPAPGSEDVVIPVTVTDNDIQNIILDQSSATITEAVGGAHTFTTCITLTNDPSGTLTVNLVSSDPGAVTVSPASLDLTTANYMDCSMHQFTVTAVEDLDVRDETTNITLSASGVITPAVFVATVTDNDTQVIVVPATVSVVEGGTATIAVHLLAEPTQDVVVTATVVNAAGKASVSGPITFTAGPGGNWATNQLVTVTGLEDDDLDDVPFQGTPAGQPAFVNFSITSAQGTTPPEGADIESVALTVLDDDAQTIIVSWSPAAPFVNSVQEGGPDGSFRVRLGHLPRAGLDDNVILTLPAILASPHGALVDGSGAPVQTLTVTFTTANFGNDQTVFFRAIADGPPAAHESGDIALRIDESGDPSDPNPDVTAVAPVRFIDRQLTVLAAATYGGLRGGTQFTERTNAQWGFTNFMVVGHDAGGVYSVGRDDRDLGSFTSGPGVGTAPADLTTQVIEFTGGSSGTFGVFATEGTGASATIRYTNVNQSLGVVGSSGTFAAGSKEFSVSHNPFAGNYGVLFRTQTDNLNFVNVGIDGTVSAIEQPTAADANADQAASIHYVGGANGTAYAFNGNNTPFAGLFTATNGGLNCLRLTATGAPVVPSFQVNSDPSFYGTTWTGNIGAFPANELGAAHHGAGGLDLEMLNLEDQAAGLPTCTIFRHFDLKGAAGITYVNTPSIAWNGVEFAIGYDTQSVIGGNTVRRVGVFIMNPLLTAAEWTDRTFDGAGDPAGERPSITWANDRWILRYAISGGGGVRVVAGSLAP